MEEIYKNLSLGNLEGEEWRDVIGFEGKYQVSNMGRVKSLDYLHTKEEKILKQFLNNRIGYLQVKLWKEGKGKTCKVHRLVAKAFLGNPSNILMINHKDECKTNNVVSNLEWCTNSYNQKYGNCPKKIAEKLSKLVYQYTKDRTLIAIWQSTMECGRQGFDGGHIAACCRGERKSHKGYIWSYTEL